MNANFLFIYLNFEPMLASFPMYLSVLDLESVNYSGKSRLWCQVALNPGFTTLSSVYLSSLIKVISIIVSTS